MPCRTAWCRPGQKYTNYPCQVRVTRVSSPPPLEYRRAFVLLPGWLKTELCKMRTVSSSGQTGLQSGQTDVLRARLPGTPEVH